MPAGYIKKPLKKKRKFTMKQTALAVLGGCAFIGLVAFYFLILRGLPSLDSLETTLLPESTRIYDRSGKELYTYGDEKRTYVTYDNISKTITDAIVSIEDKSFYTNPGFDLIGLARAGVSYAIGRTTRLTGASTISQQLIKQMFLTSERSVIRKAKELILSYQLNNSYSKEKILELYLNKISYGNNAYGVEEASKTYFGKSAKDVGIFGATILASLPRGPSFYSPYQHRDRLMGQLVVYDAATPDTVEYLSTQKLRDQYGDLSESFREALRAMTFERLGQDQIRICEVDPTHIDPSVSEFRPRNGCIEMSLDRSLAFFNALRITRANASITLAGTGESSLPEASALTIRYENGRKDLVAQRMAEDQKITLEEYRNVILQGLDFEFPRYRETIRAPHFVFYVKEYLENLYGKDFSSQTGLRIYTSLDGDLQAKAEEVLRAQAAKNRAQHGANNAALVSMDNITGEILSMVGSADYFDQENAGNVNIVTSLRQPGSAFKPIVYALGMASAPVGPETPIYDIPTSFGTWAPANYDRQFNGRMSLRTALDYSRNIPAVKMWYVAGGEQKVVDFSNLIGIESYAQWRDYGAPMSIGTAELKPLELMRAYSVFANNGVLRDLVPVNRIEDAQGNVLFTSRPGTGSWVFSPVASYLLNTIISDPTARPNEFWNTYLTLRGRTVAAKTGTANKPAAKKGGPILPGDVWTAGYTPQITTVVWAGNTDHSPMKGSCDGLNCAGPIWRDYMNYAHEKLPVVAFEKPKEEIFSATISRITGQLATSESADDFKVQSLFAVKPKEYETPGEIVQVDSLCNGPVTTDTPKSAIKRVYLSNPLPIVESLRPEWVTGLRAYLSKSGSISGLGFANTITAVADKPCERPREWSLSISADISHGGVYPVAPLSASLQIQGEYALREVMVSIDGIVRISRPIEQGTASLPLKIDITPADIGEKVLTFVVVDEYGYSASRSYTISISRDVSEPPTDTSSGNTQSPSTPIVSIDSRPMVIMLNPKEGKSEITIFEDQDLNLRAKARTNWSDPVIAVNVYQEGNLEDTFQEGLELMTHRITKGSVPPGVYVYTFEAIAESTARQKKMVVVTVLKR